MFNLKRKPNCYTTFTHKMTKPMKILNYFSRIPLLQLMLSFK